MPKQPVIAIESVTALHRLLRLPAPHHPLVSVVYANDIPPEASIEPGTYRIDLYTIALKTVTEGSFAYGRGAYDFQEGTLVCTGPGQVFTFDEDHLARDRGTGGWTLMFHPDLIRRSSIADAINTYSYFDYEIDEALHLSERERQMLAEYVRNVEREVGQNLDRHSQDLILINLESILRYLVRYYDRQFLTRRDASTGHVQRFERFLRDYFESSELRTRGLPSVERCGEELHLSSHYLSDLLKAETGKSAREHIHLHLVGRAKNLLLGSEDSVSEIAYALGFSYPQHFSTLFKSKVGTSPSAWRQLN